MISTLVLDFLIFFLPTFASYYLELHGVQSLFSEADCLYLIHSRDYGMTALRYCTDSSRHRCMRILCYCMVCLGPKAHGAGMMTLAYCMDSGRDRCMTALGLWCMTALGPWEAYCMDTSGYWRMTPLGPWEAHSKTPWGLQSHVVRCSEAFAFPLPSALFLCAPSAFWNRYRLFVVVPHPVQGHLSSC